MTNPLVETSLVMVPADTLARLESMGPDLQDVIGRTRFIENALRRQASFFPEDRAPQTIVAASAPFTAAAADASQEVPAGGKLMLFSYEVPEHRTARVRHISTFTRVDAGAALGAAQDFSMQLRLTPPSGGQPIPFRVQTLNPGAAATTATGAIDDTNIPLMARWTIDCVAFLSAGAGAVKVFASMVAIEYNLAGD